MREALYVSVLLDQSILKPLDYLVPKELEELVKPGLRVAVPLRAKIAKGTIQQVKTTTTFTKLKSIEKILSEKVMLSPLLWKFADWISQYYMTPLQKVLKSFIPPSIRNEIEPKYETLYELNLSQKEALSLCESLRRKAPMQAEVLDDFLQGKKSVSQKELLEKASLSSLRSLVEKKALKEMKVEVHDAFLLEEEFFLTPRKTLYPEQQKALEAIFETLEQKTYQTHLLYGVTGSGKTEVYLQAIEKALSLNLSTLFLVPEVSLTSQTIERIRSRFAEKVALLHHKRSLKEKRTSFEKIAAGEIKIVLGARSALFAPIQNLGLLIVDEEHDSSYKQSEEMPCYHARDLAVMRGFLEKATVVLGSATPSFESFFNAKKGKYKLHTLSSRKNLGELAEVEIVDMREAFEQAGGFTHFSSKLIEEIRARVEKGEQTLLFLNARGYYRMQFCKTCNKPLECPHCDISLVFHKKKNQFLCHICNYSTSPLAACPHCHARDTLEFKGFGTEHVERSLKALLPSLRTLRMDRDTTQKKNSHEEIYSQFRSQKADILIGTQMIAKGLHFPNVTLVGVLNFDRALFIPDFRKDETAFQLLTQVAGRAGRGELKGKVILQTFLPHHPLLAQAQTQDFPSFFEKALQERKIFNYPPFTHLIKCTFSGKDLLKTEEKAQKFHQELREKLPPEVKLLPVIAAGRAKTKDLYHFQFLIKTPKILALTPYFKENLICKIDVDPVNTFF